MNNLLKLLTLIAALGGSGTANAILTPWTDVYYELSNEDSHAGTTLVPGTHIASATGQPVSTIQTIGNVTVSASASQGVLKASVWSASSKDAVAFTGVSSYATSHAFASFFDGITINVPVPALIGQTVTVNGSLLLSGNMLAVYNVFDPTSELPYGSAYARTMLQVSGTGITGFIQAEKNHGLSGRQVTNVSILAPSVIPVSFTAQLGSVQGIQYNLDLQGQSFAGFGYQECGGGYGPCGAYASSELTAAYDQSLLWGGISSVIDMNGNPIVGFTVSSSSGFNYAVAVPEPEAWAMMLAGLGLVGWMTRRKHACI